MLSTKAPSPIQRRRTQHRRQNSTPATFEAPIVRPLPTNLRQQRQKRSGLSLDLRGLNLMKVESPAPGDSTVSNTNIGQPQQQFMQVAQPHSQPQPGFQEPYRDSSVHQSFSSPRTPQRPLRARSPSQRSTSPPKPPPSEQELKALSDHIQALYGECGQVFINILPVPGAKLPQPTRLPSPKPTPQKQHRLSISDTLGPSLTAMSFNDMPNINLAPTQSAMAFDFDNPEADVGYDSSSYYSDARSPSPQLSPRQKALQPTLEGIGEYDAMGTSQAPALFPSPIMNESIPDMPLPLVSMPQPTLSPDLAGEATLEYTGISSEEVQRYISEQDPVTNKWTCLYPDCSKVFGRRENIRSHVQTHLGDRRFRCNGCGKCFVRQHDLKRHAKIHSGNRDYVCPCGSGFARHDALTRHRQRGMCSGGFPDAVRKQAKRGRPKKNRPTLEERATKANMAWRALASAASSDSADSPRSGVYSPANTPQYVQEECDSKPTQFVQDENSAPGFPSFPTSFGEYPSSLSNTMSFESVDSSFEPDVNAKQDGFAQPINFEGQVTPFNILQQLSKSNTPPLSPDDQRPQSAGSANNTLPTVPQESSSPSQSPSQSNPFSTPPTSPAEAKDVLEELFIINDNGCSQFEHEMNAMAELTPIDNNTYEFLDFTAVS